MSRFRFLHAADLHLDSPLIGLSRRSAAFADLIAGASRKALDNLVTTATALKCDFLVLSGDIFDGDLRDIRSGRHFVKKLYELRQSGIPTFLVRGNHDAENRFVAHLNLGDVAHVFSEKQAETVHLDKLGVSIHGRSFPKKNLTDNIASEYPPPRSGNFNIGVLHTACQGREEHHARYAPCSIEQLANHGYDYWALGHVHNRATLNEDPWIVYPGNLQGRNARETGSKGVTVVEVADGEVRSLEHVPCDSVRWEAFDVNVGLGDETADILQRIRHCAEEAASEAGDRPVALRVTLVGETVAHDQLLTGRQAIVEDVETALATLQGEFWLERLDIKTRRPREAAGVDATIAGKLVVEMERLRAEPTFEAAFERRIQEIAEKIPASAQAKELLDRLRIELPDRALELAKSYVLGGERG